MSEATTKFKVIKGGLSDDGRSRNSEPVVDQEPAEIADVSETSHLGKSLNVCESYFFSRSIHASKIAGGFGFFVDAERILKDIVRPSVGNSAEALILEVLVADSPIDSEPSFPIALSLSYHFPENYKRKLPDNEEDIAISNSSFLFGKLLCPTNSMETPAYNLTLPLFVTHWVNEALIDTLIKSAQVDIEGFLASN